MVWGFGLRRGGLSLGVEGLGFSDGRHYAHVFWTRSLHSFTRLLLLSCVLTTLCSGVIRKRALYIRTRAVYNRTLLYATSPQPTCNLQSHSIDSIVEHPDNSDEISYSYRTFFVKDHYSLFIQYSFSRSSFFERPDSPDENPLSMQDSCCQKIAIHTELVLWNSPPLNMKP